MTNIVIHCYVKGNQFLRRTDIQQKSELHTSTFGSNQHSIGKYFKYHFKTQSVIMFLNSLAPNAAFIYKKKNAVMMLKKYQCHIHVSTLTQHLFKVHSSAHHYEHLSLAEYS